MHKTGDSVALEAGGGSPGRGLRGAVPGKKEGTSANLRMVLSAASRQPHAKSRWQ